MIWIDMFQVTFQQILSKTPYLWPLQESFMPSKVMFPDRCPARRIIAHAVKAFTIWSLFSLFWLNFMFCTDTIPSLSWWPASSGHDSASLQGWCYLGDVMWWVRLAPDIIVQHCHRWPRNSFPQFSHKKVKLPLLSCFFKSFPVLYRILLEPSRNRCT